MSLNDTTLSAQRTEPGVYIARNDRGAEVRLGLPGADGAFSPGELLQIAAAACAALSADHVLSSKLGPDFDASLSVAVTKNVPEERYEQIATTLIADMSDLDPERQAALIARAERAIESLCTVGRTLNHSCDTKVGLAADH